VMFVTLSAAQDLGSFSATHQRTTSEMFRFAQHDTIMAPLTKIVRQYIQSSREKRCCPCDLTRAVQLAMKGGEID
jgi:hypothetical protein